MAGAQGTPHPGQTIPEQALRHPLLDQQQRIAGHIERAVGGENMEANLQAAREARNVTARDVYQDAENFETLQRTMGQPGIGQRLIGILRDYRNTASGLANSEWRAKIDNAIDEFFQPIHQPGAHPLSRTSAVRNYDAPVETINEFQNARSRLNGMISDERASPQEGGRMSYVGRLLNDMKRELNEEAAGHNPEFRRADRIWGEGQTEEEIMKSAEKMSLNLGGSSRAELDHFGRLNEDGREMFRVGFAEALKNNILNKPEGSASITGLSTRPGVRRIIHTIMDCPNPNGRGIDTSRADELLSALDRERDLFTSTTRTLSGSRTAPMERDLKAFTEASHGAVALATGAPHRALGHIRHMLGYTVSSRAAAARNALMMTTSPGDAIQAAYALRRAEQNALARQQMIEQGAGLGALGAQNVLRSSLPYQPRQD
jgi:hypothetical protein